MIRHTGSTVNIVTSSSISIHFQVIIRSRNIGDVEKDIILSQALHIFGIYPDDRERVTNLMIFVNEELNLYCPISNRWNVLGFNKCDEQFIISNPNKRFVVFTYKQSGDVDAKVYAVYNECEDYIM